MRQDSSSVATMLLANKHLHQLHFLVCGESVIISFPFLLTKPAFLTLFLLMQTVASRGSCIPAEYCPPGKSSP